MKPTKPYNPNLVRPTWRTQPRDANGHFIKERRRSDLSNDKRQSNTVVLSGFKYTLDNVKQAYFEGANATRMYSLMKQWEIYCKKNNLS